MKRPYFARGNGFERLRGMSAAFLAVVLIMSAGCAATESYYVPSRPNGPFYYEASFDEVFEATVDSLTELKFIVTVMSRAEGFIATAKKDLGSDRRYSITVRLGSLNGLIRVEPMETVETYGVHYVTVTGPKVYLWSAPRRSWLYEDVIGEMIAKKLGGKLRDMQPMSLPEQSPAK